MKRNDYKVLVLNKDYQPLSRVPLSTISWQEAFRLCYQKKARPIEVYDDVVRTISEELPIPSVIVLEDYKKIKHIPRWSKFNVKLRDGFRCGYCERVHSPKSCTIDHIKPRAKGGKHSWLNSITACKPCNSKKADKTHMKPKIKPYVPSYYDLAKKMADYKGITNTAWEQYV